MIETDCEPSFLCGTVNAAVMAQVGTAQVGTAQVGIAQVGIAQVGIAQVGTAQVGTGSPIIVQPFCVFTQDFL